MIPELRDPKPYLLLEDGDSANVASVMLDRYLITLDTDWVSDPVVSEVSDYLVANRIKSTWFITHSSPAIKHLFDKPDLFEVGIHPNFREGSTQGDTPREILKRLLEIAPQSKSLRTHSLFQSTPLLIMMRHEFNILHDVSLYLPETPNIVPHEVQLYQKSLWRCPYFWEDSFELLKPQRNFSFSDAKYHVPGVKIFSFHPIHVLLNSNTVDTYERIKLETDVRKCSISDCKRYTNDVEKGAGTFFRELVQWIGDSQHPGLTVSDLASEWRSLRHDDHRDTNH
jgi:hypothetical protein